MKPKTNITTMGYKLFAVKDQELLSLIEYWNPESKVGKFNRVGWNIRRPYMGPFCSFTKLADVLSFRNRIRDKKMYYEIHEVEMKVAHYHTVPWHGLPVYRYTSRLPAGTVLVDEFKLTNKFHLVSKIGNKMEAIK